MVGSPSRSTCDRSPSRARSSATFAARELWRPSETFLGAQVRALTRGSTEKDTYTEAHTRRVRSAPSGRRSAGFPPTRCCVSSRLGRAAGTTRQALRADGDPPEAQRARRQRAHVVAKHPVRASDCCADARRLLRDGSAPRPRHHERLDGNGYPAGLRADELQLDARILVVCRRLRRAHLPPRLPWPVEYHEQLALCSELRVVTELDRRAVVALDRLLESERSPRLGAAALADDASACARDCPPSSTPENRSPSFATRRRTTSIVKSLGSSPAFTSSQRSGVETGARAAAAPSRPTRSSFPRRSGWRR